MALEGYLTVGKAAEDEFTEKRSRFIGAIQPIADETQAQEFIAAKAKEHWDAKHNVYAYVLERGNLCRYSDDGEPQGTAGIPVLDVLRKQGLTDCAVVVTRYFGGILLGGGGLVRAYSHAAKLAVDAAGVVEMCLGAVGRIHCDYAQYARMPALLAAAGATVEKCDFGEDVVIQFSIPVGGWESLQRQLTEQSAGQITAERLREVLFPRSV